MCFGMIASAPGSADRIFVSRRALLALVGVAVLAGWLRFSGITDLGVRFDDEACYVADARLWHRCAALMLDGEALRAVVGGDKKAFQRRMTAHRINFSDRYLKPSQGYTFLGSLMMFLVGDDPAALPVLNALCGTLAVIVVYLLGSVLFDRWIGVAGALFLAISPYHLVYCRSAWPNASAGLFLLIGVLCWALGRRGMWPLGRAYVLAGIAIGYAATCHYSSLCVVPVLVLVDLLTADGRLCSCEKSAGFFRSRVGLWVRLVGGVAVVAVAFEAVFQAARLAAKATDSFLPLKTFLEACWQWGQVILQCGVKTPGGGWINTQIPTVYAGYFVHWHGVAVGGLLLLGIIVGLRSRGAGKVIALFPIAVVVLLMVQRYTIARAAAAAVPFACLCLAVGLYFILRPCDRWRRLKPVLALVLVCAMGAYPFVESCRLVRAGSDIEAVCAFVRERGIKTLAVPMDTCNRSKYSLYLEDGGTTIMRHRYDRWGTPQQVLARFQAKGVRWLLTDAQCWHYRDLARRPRDEVFRWWQAMDDRLAKDAVLVAEFPHISDYRWEFLSEGPGVNLLPEMIERGDGPIRIYDLQSEAVAQDRAASKTW